jgi:hypothetical protein
MRLILCSSPGRMKLRTRALPAKCVDGLAGPQLGDIAARGISADKRNCDVRARPDGLPRRIQG